MTSGSSDKIKNIFYCILFRKYKRGKQLIVFHGVDIILIFIFLEYSISIKLFDSWKKEYSISAVSVS